MTCWNLAASVASLGADEDQAEPDSYPSHSGIQSSANCLVFPFTQRGPKKIGEKVVWRVGGSNRNSWRTHSPRWPPFLQSNRGKGTSKSRELFSGFGGTNFAKGKILGWCLWFSTRGRKSSTFCCSCLICTINQHLGIKRGNLYSLLGICGLYGTSSVSTEATEN